MREGFGVGTGELHYCPSRTLQPLCDAAVVVPLIAEMKDLLGIPTLTAKVIQRSALD